MRRTIIISIGLGCSILAASLATAQHHRHGDHQGHNPAPADTRELVQFPPQLVEHTLRNMRDHLLALQEITDALAKGRHDDAARVAEERLGMTSLRLHGAHEISQFMPQAMQAAGTAMHRAASRFAIEVQNSAVTGDVKPALQALSDVMTACAGCHAAYRFK